MLSDTVTLALDGDVSLEAFAMAMRHLAGLVAALSHEVAGKEPIRWSVEALEVGSATAAFRGESERPDPLRRFVHAYEEVGRTLQEGSEPPYSAKVAKESTAILRVLDSGVTAVRFETANRGATIYRNSATKTAVAPAPLSAYGAVKGRIQTLTSRHRLRFTLYDTLFDRAVTCYLADDKEEIMRDAWGRLGIVEGLVSRDAFTGRPIAVRHVEDIRILVEVQPGSYKDARGTVPAAPGWMSPEEAIRRVRDA